MSIIAEVMSKFMPRLKAQRKLKLLFRRWPGKILFVLLVTGIFFNVYYKSSDKSYSPPVNFKCSNKETVDIIAQVCSFFGDRKVTGNICRDICKNNNIKIRKCLNSRNGKYALLVDCVNVCVKGQTVSAVLKMSHMNKTDLNHFIQSIESQIHHQFSFTKVYDENIHLLDYVIDQESVVKAMVEHLDSDYGFTRQDEINLPELLWIIHSGIQQLPYSSDDNSVSISLVRTLWTLMAQGEYAISTIYKEWNLFPKIFGFCGPLYLSEYAPFDLRLDRRLSENQHISWRERVSETLQILKLVQSADSVEYPVHFCDVKAPHFGRAADGTARFIDADTVFTNKTLNRDLGSPQCKVHRDCAFFDCESWCFQNNGTCFPFRTNNNLQVTCTKILQDKESSVYQGLLSNLPPSTAQGLQALLETCSDGITGYFEGIPMKAPNLSFLHKLQNALIESLDADEKMTDIDLLKFSNR